MTFEQQLLASLPEGIALAPEIMALIRWLEARGHTQRGIDDALYLPVVPPLEGQDGFCQACFTPLPDLVRFWFGREGLERQVVPFLRAAGDGSYLALWQDGSTSRYVYLGSEGDIFELRDAAALVQIVSMGYVEIASEYLDSDPTSVWEDWFESDWTRPVALQSFVKDLTGRDMPDTAADLLSADSGFATFVAAQIG